MAMHIRGVAPLVQVYDMPTAVHFYRDVLGFEVISTSGKGDDSGFVLLRLNGVDLMLNTAYDEGERPAIPDPTRTAAHGDTCLYFGLEDLDGAYQHLRARGCEVKEPQVAHYGMRQLYVRDPDGFGLCFQWPVSPEAKEQWRKWYGMET